jgi:hypothetical protein
MIIIMIEEIIVFGFQFKRKMLIMVVLKCKLLNYSTKIKLIVSFVLLNFSFPNLRVVKKKARALKEPGELRVFDTPGKSLLKSRN